MNDLFLFTDNDIQDLLKEIRVDQENIQSIFASAKILGGVNDPNQLKMVTLDAIRRLLSYPEVVALVERLNEGTNVWDFDVDKILNILDTHWGTFKEYPTREGTYDFILAHRTHLPHYEQHSSKPFTILKEPPPEFA